MDKIQRDNSVILDSIGILTDTFSAAAGGIMTATAHGLKEDDMVVLTTDGTLPVGLSLATVYYVKYLSANTFMLKTGSGPVQTISTGASTDTDTFTMHDIGRSCNVSNVANILLAVDTAGTSTFTIKIQGSISKECPDFSAAQTKDNQWTYLELIETGDGDPIKGITTGIALTGTDKHLLLQVNVPKGLKWINAIFTAWTQGTATIVASLADNN